MAKTVDMTTGSPFKKILAFSIPIALGYLLQQLYSLGDSIIVSLSRGADATTGINITGSLNFLILGFAQGMTAGFGIVLSRLVGAKDTDGMRKSVTTSIILVIMIGIIMSIASTLLSRPLLVLLSTPPEFLEYADSYIKAIFSGLTFTLLYNMSDQIMRAMGDSKTPLCILIICAILNIGLNSLLFVFPSLPAAWAGWATIISQAISAIIGYIIIFRRFAQLRPKKCDFKFSAPFVWQHLSTGLPMSFQFMVTAIGCMIQQSAFNKLGGKFTMAQGTGNRIDSIFSFVLNGVGTAMSVYCGQNYGAGKFDRIKKGFFDAMKAGAILTLIAMAGSLGASYPMSAILLPGESQEVYDLVFKYMLVLSCNYYALFMIFMPRQSLQAIGKGTIAVIAGVLELLMRTLISFTLAVWFGFDGACWSNPLAWWIGAIFLTIAFMYYVNKLVKNNPTKRDDANDNLNSCDLDLSNSSNDSALCQDLSANATTSNP